MNIDARLDVVERRVLAQGKTPEEWAVEVAQPVAGVWTTTFYVGAQSFRIAEDNSNERKTFSSGRGAQQSTASSAEEHCMFIGRMFVKALQVMLDVELRPLRQTIVTTNDLLYDSRVDDPQHQVDSHPDTVPAVFLKLSVGHDAALEVLQEVIREWVEPETPIGLSGAFSEDLYNEDGSPVTVEQARERMDGSVSEPSSVLGGTVVAQESPMDTGREVRRVTDAHEPAGGTLDGSGIEPITRKS